MKKTLILTYFITFSTLFTALGQYTTLLPGIILPQMTTAQRTALASPQNGMLVYDTNTQSYWYRQGGTWVSLAVGGGVSNYWQLAGAGGNEIQNVNTGGFWSANPTGLTGNSNNTTNPPTAPVSGAGTRLMWIPSRSAFRAGTVAAERSSNWDAANIGLFSFASGYNTLASGLGSTAMGVANIASDVYATALGGGTTASGAYSTALGIGTVASGQVSTALGSSTTASGQVSTAMGYNTTASGFFSLAMGNGSSASASNSVAIGAGNVASASGAFALGNNVVASGANSTAMGYEVNTNGKSGAFAIGDFDPYQQGETIVGSHNQFVARFANGYYFMTCGNTGNGNPSNNIRTGMIAGPGANAWSAISDSTKKERHQPIDGEGLLHKIARFKLTTWNYKAKTPKPSVTMVRWRRIFTRLLAMMGYGVIGCDTLINQADFDGINFAAIQALVKRTHDLSLKSAELMTMNADLKSSNEELRTKNEALEERLNKMEKEWAALRQMLENKSAENHTLTEPRH